jgi:predicted permease
MNRRDGDYDEELREHIEMETRENIARGMPASEARQAALRTFGNVTSVREQLREGGPLFWLETVLQDIRYALRHLKRSPLIAGATALTLTLGIGMNTGVFTMLNGMLLRARVQKNPETFAHVAAQYTGEYTRPVFDPGFSTEDFDFYRSSVRSLENIAAWGIGRATLGENGSTQFLVLPVTCNFFTLYGLEHPKLGRFFRADECATPGRDPVAVISEEIWRTTFSSDAQVVGRIVRLNQQPFTIVGVTPARFGGQLRGPGVWVPYTMQAQFFNGHDFFRASSVAWLTMEGRLKPGETRSSAQAEISVMAQQLDRLHPGRHTAIFITNGSLAQEPSQRAQMLWLTPLIMGALLLVLLLACTNVTTLLLARATARRHEIAIRLSLGAGRKRLIRMLLIENLILAAMAGAASAWIATRVPSALEKFIPGMPHYPLEPDRLVFVYLAGITFLAAVMAGTAPALESLKVDFTAALKGVEGFSGSSRSRTRSWLIGVQLAMSLVLLAGAGLFLRVQLTSFRSSPGYETREVLMFSPRTPVPPYSAASAAARYDEIRDRLHGLAGIESVAFASAPPFSNDEAEGASEELHLPGQQKGHGAKAFVYVVSSGYFATLGIPMVRGRAFADGDTGSSIVVSDALARAFWPGTDPVGRAVVDADGNQLLVTGVARDVKSQRFGALDGPTFYRLRDPRAYGDAILVRFRGDAVSTQARIRGMLRGMDSEALPQVETLQAALDNIADSFWKVVEMVLFLGIVAMTLALIGIYGVVAFTVSRRTREIGIRMALGATRRDVVMAVIRSGVTPIVAGLSAGLLLAVAGAVALSKALHGLPVDLNVGDPTVYVAVSLLLALAALAAMLRPALRAAKLDASRALREE